MLNALLSECCCPCGRARLPWREQALPREMPSPQWAPSILRWSLALLVPLQTPPLLTRWVPTLPGPSAQPATLCCSPCMSPGGGPAGVP
eukprot:9407482-Alexandrium_andersonii.AAC.1